MKMLPEGDAGGCEGANLRSLGIEPCRALAAGIAAAAVGGTLATAYPPQWFPDSQGYSPSKDPSVLVGAQGYNPTTKAWVSTASFEGDRGMCYRTGCQWYGVGLPLLQKATTGKATPTEVHAHHLQQGERRRDDEAQQEGHDVANLPDLQLGLRHLLTAHL